MKSIYSLQVLQSILDHWSVGGISDVTYFQSVGKNVWRHHLDTNQGEFELFSYPTETAEYSEKKLESFLETHRGEIYEPVVHSFERYHRLLRLNKKYKITPKQVALDIKHLEGISVKKAFRVYGSIMQMHFENEAVIYTYAHWDLHLRENDTVNVLVDCCENTKAEMDAALEEFAARKLVFQSYDLQEHWLEFHFSERMSMRFSRSEHFAALELHIPQQKNSITIFTPDEIYYTKEL